MQSVEEKKRYYKLIANTCYTTDVVYLLLHIFYMVFFILAKAYVMIYINAVSIVLYLLFFILLKRGKYYIYAVCCGNEFLVFMSAATIICGLNTGFHLCIIGLTVVSFFTTYFSKNSKMSSSIIWWVLSLIIDLVVIFVSLFNKPLYKLDYWMIIVLFTVHILALFLFIGAYLLIFVNYAEKLEKRILDESRIDNLTKLHNRYDLYNYIDSIEDKSDYVLAIFDIDDFKNTNDLYGHICGDYILKELGKIARETLNEGFVARYGGEEFIIIFKANGDYKQVVDKLEKLRHRIEDYEFEFNDNVIHITITMGVEPYVDDMSIEEWINKADEKLYEGKYKGKNVTVV